jgi:hypothetical protein
LLSWLLFSAGLQLIFYKTDQVQSNKQLLSATIKISFSGCSVTILTVEWNLVYFGGGFFFLTLLLVSVMRILIAEISLRPS